jgi:hypothetical protein
MSTLQQHRDVRPAGHVDLRVIRPDQPPPSRKISRRLGVREILRDGFPRLALPADVRRYRAGNAMRLVRPMMQIMAANRHGLTFPAPQLRMTAIHRCEACAERIFAMAELARRDGEDLSRLILPACERCGISDLGLVSLKLVTTAGVNFIVDAFQNLVELELMRFHGIGTGTNAEAVGDVALQTELTTQYNPDSTRATGSLAEGASANIFRTLGTNTVDASVAITEHGILTQAATGAGTLLDRSVFSAINLASADSLQSTYDLTVNSGG